MFCRLVIALLMATLLAIPTAAAQNYPSKPVRFLVGYPPGGANDIVARMVSEKLSETLGQQLIVDNRPGAAGIIANSIAATATPNGYTILLVSPAITYESSLHAKLPYDSVRQFVPVSLVAASPFVILANNAFPPKTIRELMALAKAKPGQINYAHAGTGSFIHLVVALLQSLAKIDITPVAYKGGGGPAMVALMSGEVQLLSTSILPALSNIKAGRVRALAVTSAERAPKLPSIPTVAESGVPDYEARGWWGVVVPAGTPNAVIERLSKGIAQAVRSTELRENLAQQGVEAIGSSPDEFTVHIRRESIKWKKVIREAGTPVQ